MSAPISMPVEKHRITLLGSDRYEVRSRFLVAVLSRQAQVARGGRLIRIASMFPPVLRPNSVPRS